MFSTLDFSTWPPGRLVNRIHEGESLLNELPADSGWIPLVVRRLAELRGALDDREMHLTA